MIFIPLHKGADGFLSDEDYRDLYWPTLKAVILGLAEEGLVPLLFAEGGYDIGGNVPGTLLDLGTPVDVDDYVARLTSDMAGAGGFILSTGTTIDEARPENVAALIAAGRKYGAAAGG